MPGFLVIVYLEKLTTNLSYFDIGVPTCLTLLRFFASANNVIHKQNALIFREIAFQKCNIISHYRNSGSVLWPTDQSANGLGLLSGWRPADHADQIDQNTDPEMLTCGNVARSH